MEDKVDPLSDFTIVLPNEAQYEQVLKAWHAAFAKDKPFEEFARLEKASLAESWAQDGAERMWALVRKDDPEGEVYSVCGTFRRKAFMKRKGSDEVEETITYGIQSVATPVHHHRNGYARHMLKLLHYVLASPDNLPPFPKAWGTPPAPLSPEIRKTIPYASAAFLWSDVGEFYAKCTVGEDRPGYLIEDEKNRALVWKVLPSNSSSSEEKEREEWEWLYEKDILEKVAGELEGITKTSFNKVDSSSKAVITTNPANVGTLPFLPLRAMAETTLDPEFRKAHPFGLRLRNKSSTGAEDDTIVILTNGYKSIYNRLCITLHHNLRPDHLESLLAKMDELAPAKHTQEGQIWGLDPEGDLVKAFKGLEGREADPHIRQGMKAHLLAVVTYLPGGEEIDFKDSQIWNWC